MKMNALQNAFRGFDINNLDFKAAGNWPVGVKFICYLLAFAVVVGAGIHFLITDKHKAVEQEIVRENELKAQYEDKAFRVANLDALRRQMADVEERFSEILKQLPTDKEVPGLLEDISDIGRQAGLSIESIALQPETRTDFYIELPINIQVSGTYHQMGEFVSGVAAIERIVTLHDYSIQTTANDQLSMTINAKTYRYEQN
ncbi:type IV pilus inner membrane component PilO [Nitrincola iocasae]|jgi:type IV pilus assembly protein PilO|uniref:Type 4a pilus biogenesis protein PilO n=1 Tax=Nitrincola iocasae TaxID=2614693 RepID=A0A5J6LA54_9GAMM|nr:type 4a pilus biogenesis protein PilO [Nitrincola iocasae]QEW05251.1 type 4a pilus biogenesis protein PilO [Nitrincola iocasae]